MKIFVALSLILIASSCVPKEIPCFVDDNCPSEMPFCVPGNVCDAVSPFADRDAGVADVALIETDGG